MLPFGLKSTPCHTLHVAAPTGLTEHARAGIRMHAPAWPRACAQRSPKTRASARSLSCRESTRYCSTLVHRRPAAGVPEGPVSRLTRHARLRRRSGAGSGAQARPGQAGPQAATAATGSLSGSFEQAITVVVTVLLSKLSWLLPVTDVAFIKLRWQLQDGSLAAAADCRDHPWPEGRPISGIWPRARGLRSGQVRS